MPRLRRLLATAVAVTGASVAAGCGADDAATPSAGPSTAASGAPTSIAATTGPAPAPAPAKAEVPDVLRFRAPGIDGSEVVGADYAGRDVALWFWAPW